MALRDQPYLPLYVQDFMTDEKLIECSAQTTGVYVRIMCIMHKSDPYGTILLKQKDKQSTDQIINFACKLAKNMPYPESVIVDAIRELVAENVLFVDGDILGQKRMMKDNELSLKRAKAGKKGGVFAQAKLKANTQAISENEIVIENKKSSQKKERTNKAQKVEVLDLIPKDWPADGFMEIWNEFLEVRRLKKKPLTENAVKRRINELVGLSGGSYHLAQKIAQKACDAGWEAFYALKPESDFQNGQKTGIVAGKTIRNDRA